MPARKRERKHAVRAALTVHELTKAGTSLHLEIYARSEKVGDLEIGRGSLYWRDSKRELRKRISRTRFAELMDGLAYEAGSGSVRAGKGERETGNLVG